MSFSANLVNGPVIYNGKKVKLQHNNSTSYQELTAPENVKQAYWSGDLVIVITESGKALKYSSTGTYSY